VNTLWRLLLGAAYRQVMQQQLISENKMPAAAPPSIPVSDASRSEIARRAYLNYLNEGSLPGREEQHWLEAEAKLHAEIIHGSQPPST
jgi:hypothetical protein